MVVHTFVRLLKGLRDKLCSVCIRESLRDNGPTDGRNHVESRKILTAKPQGMSKTMSKHESRFRQEGFQAGNLARPLQPQSNLARIDGIASNITFESEDEE
jgi:hypothetical protein